MLHLMTVKPSASSTTASRRFAVIGDLVASRTADSRAGAQQALITALRRVNGLVAHDQSLEPTIGDEFQSTHESVADALRAAVLVRCALPEGMDARCGIGIGSLEIVGESAYGLTQDGPAWWAARTAVDEVKSRQRRLPALRTWVVDGTALDGTALDSTAQHLAALDSQRGHADHARSSVTSLRRIPFSILTLPNARTRGTGFGGTFARSS